MPDSDPIDPAIEADLLHRARSGDETAFGTLMRTHHDRIFRLIYSIVRHEHDARDLSQEVWLTVWKQLPTFRGDARFTTWLHPIATRRALDHLRKRRRWFDRFLPFAADDQDETAFSSAPEAVAADDTRHASENADRSALLKTALDKLPPKLRATLALRELEGLAYDQIARATGVPTGTVMSRLFHARRLLALQFKGTKTS